jgi:hypothetical protein
MAPYLPKSAWISPWQPAFQQPTGGKRKEDKKRRSYLVALQDGVETMAQRKTRDIILHDS